MTCAIPKWVNEEFLLSKYIFTWNSSQGCLKDSSLSWNLLKQNVHYLFYYFQSGRGWNGSMQMDAGGNSFVQRQYDVIKSQSSALAAARLSRPRLLLFASNLFLSPRLVSLILSAECRVPPLPPSSFLEIVDDRRWSQSWLYLLRARAISNTPPHLPAHSGWLKTHRLNPVESIADKNANRQSLSSSPPFTLLAFVPLLLAQLCREWQL